MTIETLERAKDIQRQIKVLEKAIDGYSYSKEARFGFEVMSSDGFNNNFVSFPVRCQQPILELLKKELDVLKKELRDL